MVIEQITAKDILRRPVNYTIIARYGLQVQTFTTIKQEGTMCTSHSLTIPPRSSSKIEVMAHRREGTWLLVGTQFK